MIKSSSWLPSSDIPALDGIRAFAVTTVIGYHGGWPGFSGGGFGVDLFFVLSGFLITWLLIREKAKHGRVSLRNFYMRRVLRIVPAYLVFLVGYAVLCVWIFRDLHPRLLESTLFAATYTTNVAFSWLNRDVLQAHTWSLSMEEQFYLAYPAFVAFCSRSTVVRVTMLLLVIAPVWRVMLFLGGVDAMNPTRIGYGPDTRFDSILWGALIAHVWTSDLRVRLPVHWSGALFTIGVTLMLVAIGLSLEARPFMVTLGYSCVAIGSGVVILAVLMNPGSRVARLLSWRPFRVIGVLSYSMYLWHPAMLGLSKRVRARTGDELEWVADVFYVFATLILSACSYWLVERQFLRLKNRWSE